MFKAKVIRGPQELTVGMPDLDVNGAAISSHETGTETEILERQAYEQAYKEGERAGYEVGLKKAEALIERLKKAVEEIESYKKDLHKTNETKVFSMAMAVARVILKEEITARVELMKGLIKEAVRRLDPTGSLHIKLHPALKEIIEKYRKELEGLHETVKIEIDPSLSESSAVVSTSAQEVPLDMDTLITNLLEQLKERLSDGEDGSTNRDN